MKEVIQKDIELILEKMESSKKINNDQVETKESWSKVVKSKHRKNNWKENVLCDERLRAPESFWKTQKFLS